MLILFVLVSETDHTFCVTQKGSDFFCYTPESIDLMPRSVKSYLHFDEQFNGNFVLNLLKEN